jgi:hypothetical protein
MSQDKNLINRHLLRANGGSSLYFVISKTKPRLSAIEYKSKRGYHAVLFAGSSRNFRG